PDSPGEGVSSTTSKLVFDRDNHMYLAGRVGRQPALLHSTDGGKSFAAYLLPPPAEEAAAGGQETFDIEEFTGHNLLDGPPPVLRYRLTAKDPKHFWRWIHTLELIVADKKDGRLEFHPPVLVSRQCIGLAAHSGTPSSLVSRQGRVHLVWAEATDPAEKAPGVPTYVATYDRHSRQLSKPVLVGYGPPPNDVHNSPSITMDSRGFLHVLCGTHGRPFPYARSVRPNDSSAWTEAKVVGEGLEQTYIGMVCGPDDTLYIAYRLWQRGKPPHPLATHATLAFQRKPADGPWQPPEILVVPPFSEYSVYRHQLTIDRRGRLFLLYDYWSTHWFYRNDHRGHRRALLFTPDSGQTWRLAQAEDLLSAK
ncbi:MAG TPA: BNR-4 repeat-containing protein, partial [Thermoguttaceae bacterium]|nr:BNR-4 repeat-containing protein [Thermoguttaceae bacterium]